MSVPPPPPSPADDQLPAEIAATETQLAALSRTIADEAINLRRLRGRCHWTSAIVIFTRLALRWRTSLGRMGIPRLLVVVTLAIVAVSSAFIAIDTAFGSRTFAIGFVLVIGPLAILILGGFSVVPSDQHMASWLDQARVDMTAFDADVRRGRENLSSLQARHKSLQSKQVNLESRWAVVRTSRDHRSRQLLAERWKELRGYDFEEYLARVFENLGFQVEQRGQSGDQGVDLIVMSEGVRIAIQAKGYVASVSNSAIQEVFTGSRIFDCNRYAVITNSRFTASAIAAADATGCLLVHEGNFADFVTGKVQFVEMPSSTDDTT